MGNGIRYYDFLPVVNKRIVDNSLGDGFGPDYRHSGNNDFQTTAMAAFHPELEEWVLLVVVYGRNPECVDPSGADTSVNASQVLRSGSLKSASSVSK
jgi:hypothetical protein